MRWVAGLVAGSVIFAAAPASADEFIAYFDYGSSTMPAEGHSQAWKVAAYIGSQAEQPRQVVVDAHMDTAEKDEFSEELALGRARAMQTELVRLGVDPSLIEMRSQGARQLARATDDHVREVLNRRVVVSVYY